MAAPGDAAPKPPPRKKPSGAAKRKAGPGAGTPPPKRPAPSPAARHAPADSRAPQAASVETTVKRRGLFAKDLQLMMYGFGDAETPYKESVDLVEDCVVEYATHLLQQASDHASQRGGKIQPEDLLFLVRKDPRKFARAQELLAMNEEIKKAKKVFEEDEEEAGT